MLVSLHYFIYTLLVKSKSSQAEYYVTYNVSPNNHQWTCTCPDYNFRKTNCKHILEAQSTRRLITDKDSAVNYIENVPYLVYEDDLYSVLTPAIYVDEKWFEENKNSL